MQHKAECKWGTVTFGVEQYPGCCGVSVLHEFIWSDVTNEDKMYEWFYNTIIFGNRKIESTNNDWYDTIYRNEDYWRVNKFSLADRIDRTSGKASIYRFCKWANAKEGTVTFNPNSGNDVQVFELTRPEDKYNEYNGDFYEGTEVQIPKKVSTKTKS